MREVSKHSEQTFPDNCSISDLESEIQTDQSVLGSPLESTGRQKGLKKEHLLSLFQFYLSFFLFDFIHCFHIGLNYASIFNIQV